jgi:LPS export ABC transporter protein LptC
MRRARLILLLSIVVIAGSVVSVVWFNLQGKKASQAKKEEPEITSEDTKMQLQKVHFVEDKGGKKTWELEARSVEQHEDQNLLILKDVKVTVYTKDGRSFAISGRDGKVNQASKDAQLSGDVVLTSSDGYRLRTQSVAYDHKTNRVTTPDFVEIDGNQIRVEGRGMLVDLEARIFKILSQVKTRWQREGKG